MKTHASEKVGLHDALEGIVLKEEMLRERIRKGVGLDVSLQTTGKKGFKEIPLGRVKRKVFKKKEDLVPADQGEEGGRMTKEGHVN